MSAAVWKDQADARRLEIDQVALEPAEGLLAASGIDTPRNGLASPFYGFDLRGWAIGRKSAIRSVTVKRAAGRPLEAEVGGDRPDVSELHSDHPWARTSGFFLPVPGLGLEPQFEVFVQAELEGGESARIAVVRGRRTRLSSGFRTSVQPIALTTLGRTGSTAAARLLSAHPNVVAYRPFEYEPRVVTYWIDILRDLAGPSSFRRQVTPNAPLSGAWWIGDRSPLPRRIKDDLLQAVLGGENVEALAELCQGQIERFYVRAAELAGRTRPRYFVEKLGPSTGSLVAELYTESREIFLVRDFRDMVASTFAFNRKRGFQGFGRAHVRTDVDYVREVVAQSVDDLLSAWRARGSRALLLRYEDLVRNPAETARRMFEFLGLDAGSEVLGAAAATLREPESDFHRTASADESIGRWHKDLAADVRESCDAILGPALREFGYA